MLCHWAVVPDILKGCVVFIFTDKLDTNQQLLISKDSAKVAATGAVILWKARAWTASKKLSPDEDTLWLCR